MTVDKRPLLRLKSASLGDIADDSPLEVAVYDALLPCRKFEISHKVAVLGRVSLTAEFMLRLLKCVEGLEESEAAAFFGFSNRDMSFVLAEVENLGFIERREGRLWLTMEGISLFREGGSQPEIFEVEQRQQTVGFDLIALAPQPPGALDIFEVRLPEMQIVNAKLASSAAKHIPEAFRRFYPELVNRREREQATKRSLYSIDSVTPKERFSSLVRVIVRASRLHPTVGEPDLSEWRPEHEQDDRADIVSAAAAFVDRLTISRRSDDADAYRSLVDIAPKFLDEFTRRDGLAVERYYREVFSRVGELRADRQTIPIIGSLFTRENVKRVFEVMRYGLRRTLRPTSIIWIAPIVPHWGATRTLPEVLKEIKAHLRPIDMEEEEEEEDQVVSVCFTGNRPEDHLEKAFDRILSKDSPPFPASLEILLVPGIFTAAVVHAPIGAPNGMPVPLGLVSFDENVINQTARYVTDRLEARVGSDELYGRVIADLRKPSPEPLQEA